MNYGSELNKIVDTLQEAVLLGDSMLNELSRLSGSSIRTPEQIHISYLNLSATYAGVDFLLKALFEDGLQIGTDSPVFAELNTFHEHNQTVQALMSELSAAFKLYTNRRDQSGMKAWREAFCRSYPDVLRSTKTLNAIMVSLLRGFEQLASMTAVYASPEMMGIRQSHRGNAPYPISHAEDQDDLCMDELYGSPQIKREQSPEDEYVIRPHSGMDFDDGDTIWFCPNCKQEISHSARFCPHCGVAIPWRNP